MDRWPGIGLGDPQHGDGAGNKNSGFTVVTRGKAKEEIPWNVSSETTFPSLLVCISLKEQLLPF